MGAIRLIPAIWRDDASGRQLYGLLCPGLLRPPLVEDYRTPAVAPLQLWSDPGCRILELGVAAVVARFLARPGCANDVCSDRAIGQPLGTTAAPGFAENALAGSLSQPDRRRN